MSKIIKLISILIASMILLTACSSKSTSSVRSDALIAPSSEPISSEPTSSEIVSSKTESFVGKQAVDNELKSTLDSVYLKVDLSDMQAGKIGRDFRKELDEIFKIETVNNQGLAVYWVVEPLDYIRRMAAPADVFVKESI